MHKYIDLIITWPGIAARIGPAQLRPTPSASHHKSSMLHGRVFSVVRDVRVDCTSACAHPHARYLTAPLARPGPHTPTPPGTHTTQPSVGAALTCDLHDLLVVGVAPVRLATWRRVRRRRHGRAALRKVRARVSAWLLIATTAGGDARLMALVDTSLGRPGAPVASMTHTASRA